MRDPAEFAAALDRALLAHGVSAGTGRALALVRALVSVPHPSGHDVYWSARISMLPRIEDLEAFNAAFVFALAESPVPDAPRRKPPPPLPAAAHGHAVPRVEAPLPSDSPAPESALRDAPALVAMASPEERLAERDFADFADHERTEMLRLVARLRIGTETRRSRRRRADRRGDRLDVRSTFRSAARTAGELMRREHSARRERVRPLVFLCDVSGSMVPYARALLQYARANELARPRVRTFAFATSLTDLGSQSAEDSAAGWTRALEGRLRDYGGGTRIGAALGAFNEHYGRRGVARGGTVVILSDGWERDDPGRVRTEMERLRRLTRRIVWVNPQKKHPGYEPLARGMAAALPFIDAFVEGHNLRTLSAVADAIDGRMKQR